MESKSITIGDRTITCFSDGSVQYETNSPRYKANTLIRTFGTKDGKGYKIITISVNGKMTHLKIHRLIALAFHPNPNNLPEVDHINRNKTDNCFSNLRWSTRKNNANNRDCIDQSIAKYGVRRCKDKKSYQKAYNKAYMKAYYKKHAKERRAYYKSCDRHRLAIEKPDGGHSMTGALSVEVYNMLKPLSQRERYFKYLELRN